DRALAVGADDLHDVGGRAQAQLSQQPACSPGVALATVPRLGVQPCERLGMSGVRHDGLLGGWSTALAPARAAPATSPRLRALAAGPLLVAEGLHGRLAGDAHDQRVQMALREALGHLEDGVAAGDVDVDHAAARLQDVGPGPLLAQRRADVHLAGELDADVLAEHGDVRDAVAGERPHLAEQRQGVPAGPYVRRRGDVLGSRAGVHQTGLGVEVDVVDALALTLLRLLAVAVAVVVLRAG